MTEMPLPDQLVRDLKVVGSSLDRVDLPAGHLGRLQQRIDSHQRRRRNRNVRYSLGLALAAGVSGLLWGFWPLDASSTFDVIEGPPGFEMVLAGQDTYEASSDGVVALPELDVKVGVRRGSRLRVRKNVITVLAGKTRMEVAHKRRSAPVRIEVSHGWFDVMGTLFRMEQDEHGGEVHLESGHLRYRNSDGRIVELQSGDSLRWPLPTQTKESPPPDRIDDSDPVEFDAANKKRSNKPLPVLLKELDGLRAQRNYKHLAVRLSAALPRISDRGMRETLSYELAEVYAYRLKEKSRGCRHIKRHRAEFGDNQGLVAKIRADLGCSAP